MGPKSRGNNRRGSGRPGRSRWRGNSRFYGNRSRFDSARISKAEVNDENEDPHEDGSSEDESSSPEHEGSEADEKDEAPIKSYMALMQSFAEAGAGSTKRRKLDHAPTSAEAVHEKFSVSAKAEEDSEREVDDVDLVDEPEEDPAAASADDILEEGSDDEGPPDSSDPFEAHFADPSEDVVAMKIQAIKEDLWTIQKTPSPSSRIVCTIPQTGPSSSPIVLTAPTSPSDLKLKQRLSEAMSSQRPRFSPSEQKAAALLFQYYDTLFCERSVENAEDLQRMACLHAINHVYKIRDRVIKNNARLAREDEDGHLEFRDQGFTRPKVLMLLPTRNSCVKMVKMICSICQPDEQENRKRFDDAYFDKEEKFTNDRPEDFKELFDRNDDDMFRLGLKFTRKTIKYFSQFYNSDIILASPLGLRMAIGSEEDKKPIDFDFLSSIEIVIMDQADALLMQNWEHVEYIFEHLNRQPTDTHGCDFDRVRTWYLDINAKYFRQTIVFSAFNTPELSELTRTSCHNWAGKVRVQPQYSGLVGNLGVKMKQTFSRFDSNAVERDPDLRFDYFTKAIVPLLVKRAKNMSGTLIFIPSYLDFVRIRNYFATNNAVTNLSFGAISEYAEVPEASRARSHFLTGRHTVLLYTERAHHFHRYQLQGVQRVIMYGLPDNPLFYRELTRGYLGKSEQDLKLQPGQGTVRVMFSKFDAMKLERIVGSQRLGKMVRERSDTFVFE